MYPRIGTVTFVVVGGVHQRLADLHPSLLVTRVKVGADTERCKHTYSDSELIFLAEFSAI